MAQSIASKDRQKKQCELCEQDEQDIKSKHDKHAKTVAHMFERIVPWYDRLNLVLSCGMDRVWRKRLVREVRLAHTGSTWRVLDLAAGTLDVSLAIKKSLPNAHVFAMDFCYPMLLQGQKKLHGAHGALLYPITADAKKIPLPDASVDAITMAFGIRNIVPRTEAFAEMARVLIPGGRACILEFGSAKQSVWGGLYNFYLEKFLPRIGKLCSGDSQAYTYLADTIVQFPTALELEEEMRTAGFATTWHIPLTSGIVCLHMGEKARKLC